jgi:hypothetical protein
LYNICFANFRGRGRTPRTPPLNPPLVTWCSSFIQMKYYQKSISCSTSFILKKILGGSYLVVEVDNVEFKLREESHHQKFNNFFEEFWMKTEAHLISSQSYRTRLFIPWTRIRGLSCGNRRHSSTFALLNSENMLTKHFWSFRMFMLSPFFRL